MKKNIVIAVLAVVIIILLWHAFMGDFKQPEKIRAHEDSVVVALADIKAFEAREKAIIKKMRDDSVARVAERKAFKKEIARYKRRLSEINFEGTTSLELDSIRNVIYAPGDSMYIVAGPDPNYSMPISQARDALEAKAREPVRDSMQTLLEARVLDLEDDADSVAIDCNKRMQQRDSVDNRNNIIIRNLSEVNSENQKRDRRRRFWGPVKDVAIAIVGFLAGRGSK